MNLKDIVNRIADGIQFVDMNTSSTAINARTGATYGLGVPAMAERTTVKEISNWWQSNHKSDFGAGMELKNEVPYFHSRRNKCDIVIGQKAWRSREFSSLVTMEKITISMFRKFFRHTLKIEA